VAAGSINGPVITGDHNTVNITYQGTPVSIPGASAMQLSPSVDVRQYLVEKYSDEDLEILCTDYFRHVHNDFTAGMSKGQKIQMLIDHCLRQDRWINLLEALRKMRPDQFRERFPEASPAPAETASTASAPDRPMIEQPFSLELVRVPAGEFLMGSNPRKDTRAQKHERPQHRVYLDEFYIGRYPVTNAQYATYAMARNIKFEALKGKDDHPVVKVSWDNATAFCEWLSQENGRVIRLPAEAEWEKAARGTDGRIYPWGNEWDTKLANTYESGIGTTTPVDKYSPDSDSPYGVADMAGNVFEWTADWYDENYYAFSPTQNPTGPLSSDAYVVRGGSWFCGQPYARAVARNANFPDCPDSYFGFRVVLAAFPISYP
jgi:formylglycine-generating enzyme required for sulfatase activity